MKMILVACVFIGFGFARVHAQDTSQPESYAVRKGAQADSTSVETVEQLKQTMAIVGLDEVPGLHGWQREKSAKIAVISSMILPGLGQVYNGRKWKAGIAFGLFTFYLGTAWIEDKKATDALNARDSFPTGSSQWQNADLYYNFYKQNSIDNVWWAGAVWFIGLLDAFVDAHLYDVRAVDPDVFESTNGNKFVGVSVGM